MRLIDHSLIVSRLRVIIENIFSVSNQAAYLGEIHHSAAPLTRFMIDRLHSSLDDLGWIVKEVEPGKIDITSLTFEDSMVIAGYAEIKQGLLKSWQFIDAREQAILKQAAGRRVGL